ncbi:MAG: LuxR C-terminal-related transcriptional regulator [Gammaproteobacteria bacterium]
MKVFVIHEAEIVRAGLRVLLQHCNDIVLSEAADLSIAATVLHTQVDLVLIGSSFFLGAELLRLRQLIRSHPRIRFIAYTTDGDLTDAQFLFTLGVRGVLEDTAPMLEVVAALRKIAAGERYLPQELVERTLGCASPDVRRLLSLRELQLMRLLCTGWRVRDIAGKIHLAPATVRWHRRRLFDKLGVNNEVQLLRRAAQLGVISQHALLAEASSQGAFRLILDEADTPVL